VQHAETTDFDFVKATPNAVSEWTALRSSQSFVMAVDDMEGHCRGMDATVLQQVLE
jgi:hypothetical protein